MSRTDKILGLKEKLPISGHESRQRAGGGGAGETLETRVAGAGGKGGGWLEPEPVFPHGSGTRLRIEDIYYILAEKKCQLHKQSQEKSSVAGAGVFGWSRSRFFPPAPAPDLRYIL